MYESPDLETADVISLIAAGAVYIASFIFVLVLAGIDYRGFLPHWRRGLTLGLLLMLIILPATAVDFAYFDPAAAVSDAQDPTILLVAQGVYIATTVTGLLILAVWTMVTYYISRHEWGLVREHRSEPQSTGPATGPIAVAAAIGAAIGVLSIFLFQLLGTGLSPFVQDMLQSYPDLASAPPVVLLSAGLVVAGIAAITEELQFRGAILGFFVRITGNSHTGFWLANLLIALAFAAMHLVNVDMPLVKFGQIFVLAIVLGVLARWAGVAAAIACHLAMNVVVVVGELVAPTPWLM